MRIVLDLPKNCKDDRDLVYSQPVSPVISILHYYRAFITSNIDALFTGKSPYFIQVLFRHHITFIHHISSGRTWWWQFPMLSVFDDIGSVRNELRIL